MRPENPIPKDTSVLESSDQPCSENKLSKATGVVEVIEDRAFAWRIPHIARA
jgi:hypothetical protein